MAYMETLNRHEAEIERDLAEAKQGVATADDLGDRQAFNDLVVFLTQELREVRSNQRMENRRQRQIAGMNR